MKHFGMAVGAWNAEDHLSLEKEPTIFLDPALEIRCILPNNLELRIAKRDEGFHIVAQNFSISIYPHADNAITIKNRDV